MDNGNGQSAPKELFSLADLGITSLNLEALERSPFDPAIRENQVVGESFFEREDGSRGDLADVIFYTMEHGGALSGATQPGAIMEYPAV